MGFVNYFFKKFNLVYDLKNRNLPDDTIRSYYKSRTIRDKKHLCHAPFNNMYFNSLGDIANCWLTFDNPERYSEDRTLKEIWFGEKFSSLRENIKQFDLSKRCNTCLKYMENGNHVNMLAKAYDNDYPLGDFPSMMEFELTNTCNLECTMCTGLLSSAIRANRDNLPKLKSPYGLKFVNELEEFIPHLHEARFNGGEPFLIKIYYDIWERIIRINPNCKMVIATNGTTLTKRVKDVLGKGNFHINISIDSLIPSRYSEIRVNGNLEKVLENFEYFKNYCKENKRSICVMINPMRTNWEEMPEFVKFCNKHDVHLWFNTIMYPEELALWNLSSNKLEQIHETLSKHVFQKSPLSSAVSKYNINTYENLVNNQIYNWMMDARKRELNNKVPTNENPLNDKDEFIEKALVYLKNNDAEKKNLIDILNGVEMKMKDEHELNLFYKLTHKFPLDVVINGLASKDVESIYKTFKEHSPN